MRLGFVAKCMYATIIGMLLSSCGDKSSNSGVDDSNNVMVGQIKTTSFTATVSGTFKGISKVDMALGKQGVLFCPQTDKAAEIFKSWKDGNDNDECVLFVDGTLNGESYSGLLNGLCPDTEYNFCLFSQNKDNSSRDISSVYSFRTLPFNPDIKAVSLDEIHYMDARAELEIGMDVLDAGNCEYGVMLSETSGVDSVTATMIVRYTDNYDSKISQTLSGIKPDKSYYCRSYVKYKSSEDRYDYKYGPESMFSTMTSDQMWVDLDLPSGIMWANCDLGNYEFLYSFASPFYQWGATISLKDYQDRGHESEWYYSHYEYWDAQNNSFTDIGQEISGTVYDAASQCLGGKWRMPTKADLDELIANCDLTRLDNEPRTTIYNGEVRQVRPVVGYVVGKNGNEIHFNANGSYIYWCGTMGDDGSPYSFIFKSDIESGHYVPNTGRIEVTTEDRTHTNSIRPVWDPNMPD